MSSDSNGNEREAVGIFHGADDLQSAIDQLLSSGFHRAQLSLLASEQAVREHLGDKNEQVRSLMDHPTVPRAAYVSPEAIGDARGAIIGGLVYVGAIATAGAVVASGGTLAAAIAGAAMAGGAGGMIGTILTDWIGDYHAKYLQQQIDRGGILLWFRTWTRNDERRAVKILSDHSVVFSACAGMNRRNSIAPGARGRVLRPRGDEPAFVASFSACGPIRFRSVLRAGEYLAEQGRLD